MNKTDNSGSSGSKKKKIVASAIAVALAAVLLIGGTISYLVSSSKTIVNTFDNPTISVSITETTKGYTIVPGTSEAKDPTVKVTAGVDAYVYLVVEDNTNGLVTYTINEKWTLLYTYEDSCPCYDSSTDCAEGCECGFCDSDGGTVYVYYMKVNASSSRQSIDCLADKTVYYSSAITNEDVQDYEDDELTLSFTAYAIQAEPFYEEASDSDDEDAVSAAIQDGAEEAFPFAYYDINPSENVDGDVALVCTESKLDAALNDSSVAYIVMVADITSSDAVTVSSGSEVTLDLNGHTLSSSTSSSAAFTIKGDLTIADSSEDGDGKIDGSSYTATGYSVFDVWSTGSLTIESGTIEEFNVSSSGVLISVGGNGGKLAINGGSITSNTAMYIVKVGLSSDYANATATMTDGTISNNSVTEAIYVYGRFDMSGGSISNNTGNGAGVAIYAYSSSSVTLSGTASISSNSGTTGTVYAMSDSTLTMSDSASISNNTTSSGAGGVYVGGTFTMTGGSITDNSAGSTTKTGTVYGGGVHVVSTGTFTMSGGTISGNSVTGTNYAYGGGVAIQNGTFTMTGGSITGNKVVLGTSNSYGAKGSGVLIYGSNASVTLDSSLITDNEAENSSGTTDNIDTVSSGQYTDTASTSE